ncbi:saccharopine dehydrogenase family protein [Natronococcus wangiae]|uniref:saccharopine dehydrogenase family protein n=1 Tax=Natronococcus wangiae TaxID=3068275 RepID=UPI00273F0689|nr:saccharopine dehydrogenase NADP-binding domain-containing protein [Natronococcus sp. AD5]
MGTTDRSFDAGVVDINRMSCSSILVAGGYGTVGRYITDDLASTFPGRVIAGGRDEQKASALADKVGNGVVAQHLDVTDADSIDAALEGVGFVINTIDHPDARLFRAAIDHGFAFTSITPVLPVWETARSLSDRAEETGARIVLGTGIQPGISNMLARLGATRVGTVDTVSTALVLSIGDEFGPASLSEMMDLASHPYEIAISGYQKHVSPFDGESMVIFPEPVGERWTYLFPLPDQFYYAQTLGADTVTVRFALDPPWLGRVLATVAGWGRASTLMDQPLPRRVLSEALDLVHRLYKGRDWFSLTVDVVGSDSSVAFTLTDLGQARATGISAATVGRALYEGRIDAPGVRLSEEVIDPTWFFGRLAKRNLTYETRSSTISPTLDYDSNGD